MKYCLIIICLYFVCQNTQAQQTFTTASFKMEVNNKGQVTSLMDLSAQKEYVYHDTTSALLRLKTKGQWELPTSMQSDRSKQILIFRFPSQVVIDVKAIQQDTHISFEITGAKPMERIDRIMWGSIATTINKTVGEIIGVVRNDNFAIGIQALNIKTIGGYPFNDEGYELTRGSAALPKTWGSVLQAYSINRALPRKISVWNNSFENMPVVPLPNETVAGSKIAIFGVAENKALEIIGKIELAEGLPHPVFNGEWIKQSAELGRSYIISNFSEDDVDDMIKYVQRAGLMSLYHEGPFTTWGTYAFNPKYFPKGKEGVKQAVKKTHAAGLHFGVHTLTNFINPTDPYVSPKPDARLVKTGSSKLTQAVIATSDKIVVASPEYFNDEKNNTLHTVQVGSELIRYRTVTSTSPFTLLDCQRGAYGTQAAAHEAGSAVSKLMDHSYEVFFPSVTMQNEIAKNLALLFNETGIDHLDFDGHEGGIASGQGDYGIEAFSKTFYDHADHFVVNGTSNSKHFYWHMNTYCNWGEPWYGGFRESMQEYRISNQALFERNYMPNMMGWYLMTSTTSLSEMEWMLARAAGYNAGFAMVLRVRDAQKNPNRDELLDAIREWESARRKGAFSSEQRSRLKDPKGEFHLDKISNDEWRLYPFHYSDPFTHHKKDLQPGEPTHSTWNFVNANEAQPLQFTLEVTGAGSIVNPALTLDQFSEMTLPVTLQSQERLVVDGVQGRVYDVKGKQRAAFDVERVPLLSNGNHKLKFKTAYGEDETSPAAVLMIKTRGAGEIVKKKAEN
jgi:hypothetical protein